jgi:hypothetical protein
MADGLFTKPPNKPLNKTEEKRTAVPPKFSWDIRRRQVKENP